MDNEYKIKPFLKWVGGKTQILPLILNSIPKKINTYYEPFLGGGSVLLGVLSLQDSKEIEITQTVVSDLNPELINTYKNLQSKKEELYNHIELYSSSYNILSNEEKEDYYYKIREKYNKMGSNVEKSALFIILNKTCFRGIYREGPNGFNVPFGHYKQNLNIKKDELFAISNLIKNVVFECKDFSEYMLKIKPGDFIYMDPPYVPENSKSFVKYNVSGFNIDKHKELFDYIIKWKNIKFLLSNSNTELVLNYFQNSRYQLQELVVKRSINSKNPGIKGTELLIKPI